MRELSEREKMLIGGGLATIPVVGWYPSPTGGGITFSGGVAPTNGTPGLNTTGMAAGGGGSGGITVPNTLKLEIENGIEALAKELSLAKFGANVLGPELQAIQAGNFSQDTMNITMQDFNNDFNNYTKYGVSGDVSAQGSLLPWQKLDWTLVDPHQNLTENQVVQNMIQLTSQGVNIWDNN